MIILKKSHQLFDNEDLLKIFLLKIEYKLLLTKYYHRWVLADPEDDVERTVEFDDFFIITPAIRFFNSEHDFKVTGKGEKGWTTKLQAGYESGSNPYYLDVEGVRDLLSLD